MADEPVMLDWRKDLILSDGSCWTIPNKVYHFEEGMEVFVGFHEKGYILISGKKFNDWTRLDYQGQAALNP